MILRPFHYAGGDPPALELQASVALPLGPPDAVLVDLSRFGGSACGRGLSGNPFSSTGFERSHDSALTHAGTEAFAHALLAGLPAAPADRVGIVAATRAGRVAAPA